MYSTNIDSGGNVINKFRNCARMVYIVLVITFTYSNSFAQSMKILPLVAVMPLSSQGVDTTVSQIVTDGLSDELLKTGKMRVMERLQMRKILAEQDFQQSGACDGSECAVEVGKLLSVSKIVVGSLGKIGGSYSLTARFVDVKTGEVQSSVRKTWRGEIDEALFSVLPEVSSGLSAALDDHMVVAPIVPTKIYKMDVFIDPRDGYRYHSVQIGNQVWIAENLFHVVEGKSWCYGNDTGNCEKYGRLYNWNGAMNACPEGWHLPSNDDWNLLEQNAGGKTAGKALKSLTDWKINSGIDAYGFKVLPGGSCGLFGVHHGIGDNARFWTSTEGLVHNALYRIFENESDAIGKFSSWDGDKSFGYSVRCLKDQ